MLFLPCCIFIRTFADSEDYPTLSKMYALQKQLNSKQDITAMAVERLCRFVLPGEKVLKRPSGLPAYPIETMSDLKNIEDFLSSDLNRSSTVSAFSFIILSYFMIKIGVCLALSVKESLKLVIIF